MASMARRYAQALLEALKTPEDLERAEQDLHRLATAVAKIPAMNRFLSNPGAPAAKKQTVLDLALGSEGSPAVRRLADMLMESRRLRETPAIAEAFSRLKDRRLSLTSVEVTTAQVLADADRTTWEATLARLTGGSVRVNYRMDSSLIGGAMARIGSVVYDGSVKGSLERIRSSLLGE